MSGPQTVPKVTTLNTFPIKSCKAVKVDEIEVDSWGVVGDRRFMVVDGNGRFVSQRKFSKLATVSARFVDEGGKRLLHVSAPGMDRDLKYEPKLKGKRMDVSIWESKVRAIDQGDAPAQWFNTLIGHGSMFHRLVASAECSTSSSQSADEFHRFVDNLPHSLKERLPSMQLALADAGPVSLISEESLADLNHRLKERIGSEVPLNRFRMNIEISGCSKPFEEDEWLLIHIGSVPFLSYRNAERCKVTGIDQATGEPDKFGPLEILREYRAPRGPTHAMFGQLMVPLQSGGRIRVGDTVEVLERKKIGQSGS